MAAAATTQGSLNFYHTWNTGKDEVMCVHISREKNILTGHESSILIWSLDTPAKGVTLTGTLVLAVEGSVTCICQFPQTLTLAISVDKTILIYHYAVTDGVMASFSLSEQFCFNQDEINQIAVHSKGSYICSCDDSGEVKVIDVENKRLLRTLSRLHDSICSTVKFSTRKPWELLSGGLDCTIGRWDFNRGRLLANVSTNNPSSGSCVVNPPMVHSLDIFSKQHFLVCGLGDGRLTVYSLKSSKGVDLVCEAQLHQRSVACVQCIEMEKSGSFVVSVGNDGVICVTQFLYNEGSQSKNTLALVGKIVPVPKVNWIDISYTASDSVLLFTADVVGSVSIYKFCQS